MIYKPHFLYRLKLILVFLLVKVKFIHSILPKNIRDKLPIGWNNKMFGTAFKSGGKKLYFTYYSELREPNSYTAKSVVDPKYKLTEEEISLFSKNGYIGPFDLMSFQEANTMKNHVIKLDKTESEILSYYRGDYQFEAQINGSAKNSDHTVLSETNKFFARRLNSYNRHLEDYTLLNLFKNPAITERCAQLLGSDIILWHSNFFQIPPHSNGTPWHQTNTWFMDWKKSIIQPANIKDIFSLTCWIALTDVPKEKSCLTVIPGTQRKIYPIKFKKSKNKSGSANKSYGELKKEVDYPFDSANVHFLEAKAGQFFIFSERVIHGSTRNVTDDYRWALVGRIVKTDTKIYTEKMLQEGYDIKVYGAKKIKLDNWKAVLIRGEDRFGYNRLL
ncbi:phytanoyl-CoA dioxygenase family protein [Moorena sp. SIO4G3]|uniref:phytanoyl-CoA dioxygenase family protein n=1 Tax=Moorena sp. SIO4G3 TaxID=2607821 RepID=UPI00142B8CF7|nr:phytanoyl-CoA dioxygenase family protein [Moorena sp. SIO4G3]NEO81022.1 hypothetical protein [Moorena sp. SIO4G3]